MTKEASLKVEFSVQVNQSQANVSNQGSLTWRTSHPLKASSSSLCCIYFLNRRESKPIITSLVWESSNSWSTFSRMDGGWDTTEPGQEHLSGLLPQCSRQQVKTWGGHHRCWDCGFQPHTLTDHEQENLTKRCWVEQILFPPELEVL